ncbi:hypothetical protein VitviT2T_023251 [Vitis vinifera]|uniref:Reverse transcriptase Ty1/copia-type domain-containing protein n=1 Tax=Vitis vinifera TaxID=29760 RepID=A0ABY9DER2_VITVI|nr:hypothetical protein VitviT2T_023251 [Vitis vinifera]
MLESSAFMPMVPLQQPPPSSSLPPTYAHLTTLFLATMAAGATLLIPTSTLLCLCFSRSLGTGPELSPLLSIGYPAGRVATCRAGSTIPLSTDHKPDRYDERQGIEDAGVCLYVDDMLILSDDMKGITETKRFLSLTFKMKDFGEVDTILGIKVKRNSGGYALNQTHYIEKLVSKFSHLKIKDANTPFDSSIKLEKNDGRLVAQLEYANAIGSLMYAAQCTRVAISFAVSKLSRFISNPSVEHWKAIGRVLGYLKNTKELSLQYSKFPAILEGYSDASWISSVGDNLSTTGWVFTLGGGAISWGSKKQTCISHSTMEAEFIALAATGKEAEWLRDLMMDIPFTANNVSTVSIHYDSQATLAHAYSGVYNGKSIHISIRHEYVRQLIQYRIISISFVRSSGNLADPFTKPLTKDLVRITYRGMRLKLLK